MNDNKKDGTKQKTDTQPNGKAIIPLLVFVALYLGVGIVLTIQGVDQAFYQFPSPIAVLVGVVVAFVIFGGTVTEKFSIFFAGCGDENIMTMCGIYLFAGGFSTVTSTMGGVDSIVNLGLSVCPVQFVTAGLFIIAAFLALATGSAVGTVSAVGPIAIAVADKTGLSLALVMGAVIGGGMFGDNLSIISDTTIAATRTQGVEMKDKFRMNLTVALPAAITTFILLMIFARPETAVDLGDLSYDIIKVIPYLFVLITALAGINVFAVLGGGIVLSGVIGIIEGSFNFLTLSNTIYSGFEGMMEIFLLSMFIGGLSGLCSRYGGIQWMVDKIIGFAKGEKSAEIGVSLLASVCDVACANNTCAIVVAGQPARKICEQYKLDPRKSASLLDIWSCVFQGLIPYSIQILVACGLTNGALNPLDLYSTLWYQYLLAVFAILSIFVPYADGVMRRHPWNFDTWSAE